MAVDFSDWPAWVGGVGGLIGVVSTFQIVMGRNRSNDHRIANANRLLELIPDEESSGSGRIRSQYRWIAATQEFDHATRPRRSFIGMFAYTLMMSFSLVALILSIFAALTEDSSATLRFTFAIYSVAFLGLSLSSGMAMNEANHPSYKLDGKPTPTAVSWKIAMLRRRMGLYGLDDEIFAEHRAKAARKRRRRRLRWRSFRKLIGRPKVTNDSPDQALANAWLKQVGGSFAEFRSATGIAKKDLADRAGVSEADIESLEAGSDVRLSVLQRCAAVLKIPLSELLA